MGFSLLCALLLLPSLYLTVSTDSPPTEIIETELPTAFEGNDTEEGPFEEPCGGTNCGIHVFRVALSSRPEEVGDVVPVKQRTKYGKNVYVPRGSQDSFVLQDLAKSIPSNIDSRVKDRIHDQDFVIKPIDAPGVVWVKEGEPIPQNFEPMRYVPTTTTSPKKESMSMPVVILLIVVGVLCGILLTALCFVCIVYNRRPLIDRSAVVTHRRVSFDTLPMHTSISSAGRYLPPSSRNSSHSTFDESMEMDVFDDSSFRTRSSTRLNPHSPRHTSSEFEPLHRKISI